MGETSGWTLNLSATLEWFFPQVLRTAFLEVELEGRRRPFLGAPVCILGSYMSHSERWKWKVPDVSALFTFLYLPPHTHVLMEFSSGAVSRRQCLSGASDTLLWPIPSLTIGSQWSTRSTKAESQSKVLANLSETGKRVLDPREQVPVCIARSVGATRTPAHTNTPALPYLPQWH